jgi:hypothetical protein
MLVSAPLGTKRPEALLKVAEKFLRLSLDASILIDPLVA